MTILDVVRKAAKPGIWSAGVSLARAGAVAEQARTKSEVELRVKGKGRVVPLTVVLYLGDEEWECDCDGRVDPCEHVVAGAIAFSQAGADDAPVAAARRWSRVVYRLCREGDGLAVERFLAHPDRGEEPLVGSLTSLLADSAKAAGIQAEQADLAADRLLDRPLRGPLPAEKLHALLAVLDGARNVLLDGRPVAVSGETILPTATVADDGPRFRVTIARPPEVDEVLAREVVRCGDAIARVGEVALCGPRLEKLPLVRVVPPEQSGELSATIVPDLAARMPVVVDSKRLPPIDRSLTPRVSFDAAQLDAGVSILPTIVYGAPPTVRVDGGRMVWLQGAVPVRDEAAEQRLVHRLRDELNMMPGRRATFPLAEVARVAEKLRRFGGALHGDAAALVRANARLVPSLRLRTVDDAGAPRVVVDLEFAVEEDGRGTGADAARAVDADAVLRAWREGAGLVALEGGGFAPLPKAWLDQHGVLVADLLAARDADGAVAGHAAPALRALCTALDVEPPAAFERLRPLWEGFAGLPDATLPADLAADLRPYQRDGVRWLSFLQQAGLGGVLADDMGLGKTLQALCVVDGRASGAPTLVVCPTSVLPNWRAEIARFRPALKVAAYHGPDRALDETADVVVTTYAILRLDAALLSARKWRAVVLDEAQAIKNPDSQVARAAYALSADFRLALSGTPVENRLEELWSLLRFAAPGLLGGRREFVDGYARPIAGGRADVADKLRKRVKPFVLRRLKRDVAPELPPRVEAVLPVALDDRERAVYDAVRAATQADVVALLQGGGSVLQALEALLRLRQAACHVGLVPGHEAASSSKVEALVDALGSAVSEGHKALVFSQWTSLLDRIEPALTKEGIAFDRLDGATKDRGAVVERFQRDDGSPVLLMSLKAGGTGLNLTAADHVFLVDPWWNPAAEAQAADRAHRIGQQRTVLIHRLVAQGTVEERILLLQEKKRALFEAALGDASAASAITREDLLQLFA